MGHWGACCLSPVIGLQLALSLGHLLHEACLDPLVGKLVPSPSHRCLSVVAKYDRCVSTSMPLEAGSDLGHLSSRDQMVNCFPRLGRVHQWRRLATSRSGRSVEGTAVNWSTTDSWSAGETMSYKGVLQLMKPRPSRASWLGPLENSNATYRELHLSTEACCTESACPGVKAPGI